MKIDKRKGKRNEDDLFEVTCELCDKSWRALWENQGEWLLKSHKLYKHRDMVKIEDACDKDK